LSDQTSTGRRLLRARYLVYALVVLALLVFRTIPSLRSRLGGGKAASGKPELVVSGLDAAPKLIPSLVAYYQSLYPRLRMEVRHGGTIRAAEDLLNRRADVAFMSRPLSAAEDSLVRAHGDSLMIFPVALSGTLVLRSGTPGVDSLSVGALRSVLRGRLPAGLAPVAGGVPRVFVPDAALGLWGSVAEQLGLGDTVGANITWVEDERAVARAVTEHPGAIGLVSALTLTPGDAANWRTVRLTAGPGRRAAAPTQDRIAGGQYPLYHRLYAACRAGAGVEAIAFISFASGAQGQMLVRQEGYLPAQEIAREIQLAQRPVGMPR